MEDNKNGGSGQDRRRQNSPKEIQSNKLTVLSNEHLYITTSISLSKRLPIETLATWPAGLVLSDCSQHGSNLEEAGGRLSLLSLGAEVILEPIAKVDLGVGELVVAKVTELVTDLSGREGKVCQRDRVTALWSRGWTR